MKRLSKNFTLKEFTVTNQPFDNTPSDVELYNLFLLANYILQPIRDRWGRVKTNSVFRSLKVNRAVGSSDNGQHPKGQAGDITTPEANIYDVYHWIVTESGLPFGSCILEYSGRSIWIHVSLMRMNKGNQQALIYDRRKPKGERYTVYDPAKRDKLENVFK